MRLKAKGMWSKAKGMWSKAKGMWSKAKGMTFGVVGMPLTLVGPGYPVAARPCAATKARCGAAADDFLGG
jgi:hypothetical protein